MFLGHTLEGLNQSALTPCKHNSNNSEWDFEKSGIQHDKKD